MKNRFLFFLSLLFFATVMPGCKREILEPDRDDAMAKAKSVQPGEKEQLVTGLEELQGSTVGPDKALYVTAPLAGTTRSTS